MMDFGRVIPVSPPTSPGEKMLLQNRMRAIDHEIRKVSEAISTSAISRSEGRIRKAYLEGRKADLSTIVSRTRSSTRTYKGIKKYVFAPQRPDTSYSTSIRPPRNQMDYQEPPVFDYSTGRMKPVADVDVPGLPVLKPMDIARQNDIREARVRNRRASVAKQNKITQMMKRAAQQQEIAEARQRDNRNRQIAINRKKATEVRRLQQMDLQFQKKTQQIQTKKVNRKRLDRFVATQMTKAQKVAKVKRRQAFQAKSTLQQQLSTRKATREQHQIIENNMAAKQRADTTRFKAYANAREAESKDREVKRFMQSRGR